MATVKITTAKSDPQMILLFERHRDHPEGEAVISSDGRTYEVAETPAVRTLLAREDESGNPVAKRGSRFSGEADLGQGEAEFVENNIGASGGVNPGVELGGDRRGEDVGEDGKENTGSAFTADAAQEASTKKGGGKVSR